MSQQTENRVKKLTKFFGDEPPLLRLYLKSRGYEKYAGLCEEAKIGMLELPYLSEDREVVFFKSKFNICLVLKGVFMNSKRWIMGLKRIKFSVPDCKYIFESYRALFHLFPKIEILDPIVKQIYKMPRNNLSYISV